MNRLAPFFFPAFCAGMTLLASCGTDCLEGNGQKSSQNRELESFSEIEVNGSYDLILRQDSVQSVRIEADENLLPHILTEVSGGRLRIYSEQEICEDVIVGINVPDLRELEASGAVDIDMTNRFVQESFRLQVSGAAEAELQLEAKEIHTELSGAGEIQYKGTTALHRVRISGAGELEAGDLEAERYDIEVSGAADCFLNVSRELNIRGSGASSIRYRGNPQRVNQEVSGAVNVRQVN